MTGTTISQDSILVRCLDVTARLTNEVVDLSKRPEGGILLETLVGRYVVDRDGRKAWLLIDGRHSVAEIAETIAASENLPVGEVFDSVYEFCSRLHELGLIEDAESASDVNGAKAAESGIAR